MDLTATILAAAAAIPPDHALDGRDLLPILSGASPIVERRLFWRIKRPVEQRAVRAGGWKLLMVGAKFYLFDVANDPGERHDLTAAHSEMVRTLNLAFDAWSGDVDMRVR